MLQAFEVANVKRSVRKKTIRRSLISKVERPWKMDDEGFTYLLLSVVEGLSEEEIVDRLYPSPSSRHQMLQRVSDKILDSKTMVEESQPLLETYKWSVYVLAIDQKIPRRPQVSARQSQEGSAPVKTTFQEITASLPRVCRRCNGAMLP